MMIDIQCHRTTLSPALSQYVEQKACLLERHTATPLEMTVFLAVDAPGQYRAEANLSYKGRVFNARGESGDMYQSIDRMVHRLDRLMRKEKTARLKRQRRLVKQHENALTTA